MMAKHDRAITAIAYANNVDMGVAFDMLKSNMTRGGSYPYVKVDEFMADMEELLKIAGAEIKK